jgi:DmsE family decaheme c-type cytochrome
MARHVFIPAVALLAAALAVAGPTKSWDDCAACHEEVAASFGPTTHGRLRAFEAGDGVVGCASCHGDAAKHLETGDPDSVVRFGKNEIDDSRACLSCHAARSASEWSASAHAGELGCTSCHTVHGKAAPESKCASCHADVAGLMNAPSHHPVREGKMSCASCHNVHSANPGALVTSQRTNDLCTSCHGSKEGPFVFQHEPVEEDCSICHTPHGSVANNLLTANEPFLCLQCHELHFHAGLKTVSTSGSVTVGGKAYPNVMGEHGYQRAFGTKCTQCHTQIHGSDLPSQAVTSGGSGLVR